VFSATCLSARDSERILLVRREKRKKTQKIDFGKKSRGKLNYRVILKTKAIRAKTRFDLNDQNLTTNSFSFSFFIFFMQTMTL
jgi:hypothetical protein